MQTPFALIKHPLALSSILHASLLLLLWDISVANLNSTARSPNNQILQRTHIVLNSVQQNKVEKKGLVNEEQAGKTVPPTQPRPPLERVSTNKPNKMPQKFFAPLPQKNAHKVNKVASEPYKEKETRQISSSEKQITPTDVATAQPEVKSLPVLAHSSVDTQEWDNYKQKIFGLIEAQKSYPKRLIKMRREGSVTLEFTLSSQGKMSNIQVISKSGHHLFEQASLRAIDAVKTFPEFPQSLTDSEKTFVIAMNYHM